MTTSNTDIQNSDIQNTDTSLPEGNLPSYIDIDKWGDQGYHWQGQLEIANFKRLSELVTQKPETIAPLMFTITQTGGVYWFAFDVQADVETQCQRCLDSMNLQFSKQVKIAVLEKEEQAKQLDEDDDWVLIEDIADIVGREVRLPIADMLEDELLLEVPLSPKHEINDEDCVPVDIIEDDDEEDDDTEEKENPFAMLAGLKGQLGK